MVEIAPFRPEDIDQIDPQRQHLLEAQAADWRAMAKLAGNSGPAWTGRIDGRVIGCAGFALLWQGRAAAWCLIGQDIPKRAWLGIYRAIETRIAQLPALGVQRLEAEAQFAFLPGNRLLTMLGFEREGLARRFGPDGSDFNRYARLF